MTTKALQTSDKEERTVVPDTLSDVSTVAHVRETNGETVIDFDIAANTDYEVQSCVIVDDQDRVVEAAVRFGRIEERDHLGIGRSILSTAWGTMVSDATNGSEVVKSDLSDFSHIVPHLRIERMNIEESGRTPLTLEQFADVVNELATLVGTVLRGDDKTIDQKIDSYL